MCMIRCGFGKEKSKDIPEQAVLHYISLTISGSNCVLVLSEN